ncbi:serine protease inhibitor-like isoform X2 [Paramacrobiotus metropolitanus]|nr:serine protease inhibitor-like isoform X2 [Paramacrobiotus metropolitanus]
MSVEADLFVKIYRAAVHGGLHPSSNIIVCPYSIEHILATLLFGAKDKLREDLMQLLCSGKRSVEDLRAALSVTNDDGAFSQVNAIFYSNALTLKPSFKNVISTISKVVFVPVNFEDAVASRKAYNEFLRDHASVEMAAVLPESDMVSVLDNENTCLIVVNMLDFSAPWVRQFDEEDTADGVFTCMNGDKKTVPFLVSAYTTWRSFNVMEKTSSTDPQMVIMDAAEKRYSIMLLLPPDTDGLRALEDSLTAEQLRTWRQESIPQAMVLSLPKFRITTKLDLQSCMLALGLSELYTTVTGFSDMFGSSSLIGVTEFRQSVVFEFDEMGVKSRVATMFGAEYMCVPIPHFRANRPFLLVVWHNQLDLPLFIGRVMDPTA